MSFLVVECACGEHFHREYAVDCGTSVERLTAAQLDAHFGPCGWRIAESLANVRGSFTLQKPNLAFEVGAVIGVEGSST
jgi:hypothetical protein